MNEIEKTCSECGAKLVEIDFNKQRYIHLCLNNKCCIRRQPQGSRAKNPDPFLAMERIDLFSHNGLTE